ncbi:hypothetical protein PMZ80_008873 [Knufia obscura]|uniref:Uncharacterized protein n=1 Tax=Knufia obscura TaxID=1635080 RepID=A0ABR0RDI2_9EURO|nr:hypothetical protein PMZ80_008873 [Knufia obscura]
MRPGSRRQVYRAVSTDSEGPGTHVAKRKDDKFDFKPVPLGSIFLTTFLLTFAICIALIEVLLHNTSTPAAQATPSVAPTSTTPRRVKRGNVQHGPIFRRQYEACTDLAAIPAKLASLSDASLSLCSDFTVSYLSHTANLSWPLQSALSQWLIPFNDMTSSTQSLSGLTAYCDTTSPPKTYASGSVIKTVPVGCSSGTIELSSDICTGFGKFWIENFALTSTINPVCGVSSDAVIVPTSQPRDESSYVLTDNLLVTDTRGVDPGDTIVPEKPSESASGQDSLAPVVPSTPELPTITVAIEPTTVHTPALVGPEPTLPRVTLTAGSVQTLPAASEGTGSPPGAAITKPPPATQASGSPAVGTQTIITNVDAIAPVVATYTIEDSAGSLHTITTEVNPLAPMAATYMVTDSLGQVQAAVTTYDALAALQATFTFMDSSGVIQTAVAAIGAIAGSSSVFTTVNTLGQVETLVAIIGTPTASSLTYLVTNSDGHVETVVTAIDALATALSTSIHTYADGKVETIVTPAHALAESLTTYTTTRGGKVETVVATLGTTATSSGPRYTTTTQYTSMVTTTGANGKVTSFSAVVIETVVLTTSPAPQTLTSSRTSSATTKPSVTRPPQPSFVLTPSEKTIDGTFTKASYFLSMYLAPLLAVVIKAMWETVFAAIRLIQPFERMAGPVGAGAYSLFAQYLSSSFSFDMFNSIGYGNLLPLWSAILYSIVQIGAPLAAASMTVKSRDICIIDGKERRCDPTWVVNVPLLRGLEGVLVTCLILVFLVLWSARRSRSGVSSDPSSLASLALLMNHESLLHDIQQVDPDADHSAYEAALEGHRVRLGHHNNNGDRRMYGIISSGGTKLPELDDESTAYGSNTIRSSTHYTYQAIHNPATTVQSSSYARTTFVSRARHNFTMDILGLFFPLTLLTLVLTFYLDNNLNDIFNKFLNSNTIGPKLVLVGLASLSSLHLSHLERSVRITEPFRRLAANAPHSNPSSLLSFFGRAKRRANTRTTPAPPETTILISRSGTRYSNIPQCLALLARHQLHGGRMMFQTLLSLTAILSDLNIIAVAGVPYNDAMTWEVYQGSCIASLAITSWIVLMYIVVLFWWRRNEVVQVVGGRSISKGVGTIGGLMRWLLSGGPEVIEAIGRVKEERNAWKEWKKRYAHEGESGTKVWFGRTGVVGANGKERWAVCCETRSDETSGMRERTRGSSQGLRQWF